MVKRLIDRLWKDDGGALIAMEFLFVATILVIGIIAGLVNVREAVKLELTALANAILALNPGFIISGNSGCCAATSGSQAIFIPVQLPTPVCTPPEIPVVISPTLPCS
jgi:Flp pilus assembly pilin Flp